EASVRGRPRIRTDGRRHSFDSSDHSARAVDEPAARHWVVVWPAGVLRGNRSRLAASRRALLFEGDVRGSWLELRGDSSDGVRSARRYGPRAGRTGVDGCSIGDWLYRTSGSQRLYPCPYTFLISPLFTLFFS